jgi:transketolase
MSTPTLGAREAATLKDIARRIRISVIEHAFRVHSAHLGSALSSVEILTVLLAESRDDPSQRPRIILSKGHACLALYCTLVEFGLLDGNALDSYGREGSVLGGHVTDIGLPGAEVATGSLGHGLSIGLGMALAGRRVRVVLGDGECEEGATWEAALLAATQRVKGLVAIVDANGLRGLGPTDSRASTLVHRWKSFGWAAWSVDGHNVRQLRSAIRTVSQEHRPCCLVARTVKGKGVSFMEGDVAWHYRIMTPQEFQIARRELGP